MKHTCTFALVCLSFVLSSSPVLAQPWGDDVGYKVVPAGGSLYVVGVSTAAWGTPVRAYTAGSDAFVAKLDSSGTILLWNTFLGGAGSDGAYGLVVDPAGNIFVGGTSYATWGAPTPGTFSGTSKGFIAKLDPSGNLLWHTFVGSADQVDAGNIARDALGNVYMTGRYYPGWAGSYDSFALKVDSSGNLVWDMPLGGDCAEGGGDVALNAAGTSLYVTGLAQCSWAGFTAQIPVRPHATLAWGGVTNAFVANLDSSNGNLQWHTFLGGNSFDHATALAVDSAGNAFVTGYSDSNWESPLRAYSGGWDDFVVELDASGNLLWNTFLGGASDEQSGGIALDGGYLHVSGSSINQATGW